MVNGAGFRKGLIVAADGPFSAELYNFLLLIGFRQVVSKHDFTAARNELGKRLQLFDAVLADVESLRQQDLDCIEGLARSHPATSFILLIKAQDRRSWEGRLKSIRAAEVVLKDEFARDLLSLFAKRDPN